MKEETYAEILIKVHERIKTYLEKNFPFYFKRDNRRIRIIHREDSSILFDYYPSNGRIIYRYIRVKDSSTGDFYFLSVPNEVRNCKEALAWTFRVPPNEYNLVKET